MPRTSWLSNPGSGKTHLVCALGQELILLGRRVLFSTCALLVQRLLRAKIDLTLEKELKKLDRFEALIVDDIGYVQQSREEMEVLFTLLAHRYERRSILLTSNLIFSDWEVFKDPLTTAAAIDRLVHHSVILETQRPELSNGERQGKAAGNHEEETAGGQIRANRLIGGKCGEGDRRVPAKERSYSALQRPLSSLVDLVHSPRRQRERGGAPFGLRPHVPLALGTISLFYRKEDKGPSQRTATALFF